MCYLTGELQLTADVLLLSSALLNHAHLIGFQFAIDRRGLWSSTVKWTLTARKIIKDKGKMRFFIATVLATFILQTNSFFLASRGLSNIQNRLRDTCNHVQRKVIGFAGEPNFYAAFNISMLLVIVAHQVPIIPFSIPLLAHRRILIRFDHAKRFSL